LLGGGLALQQGVERASCWQPAPAFVPLDVLPFPAPQVVRHSWRDYSAVRLAASSWRLIQLCFLLGPTMLLAPFCLLSPWSDQWRPSWAARLASALEDCGPAFIKWAQWASTRQDIFPRDICSALARLQDASSPHPGSLSRSVILAAFGVPVEELFQTFEDCPVASGSIAQVHKATLSKEGARRTGQQEGCVVAVKVRHPGVVGVVERDFSMMAAAAALMEYLPGLASFRLGDTLAQFRAPLVEQIDLRVEAENLRRFAENFREVREVTFPAPMFPLVAEDVLVESFEQGLSILHLLNSESEASAGGDPANNRLKQAIAQLGCKTLLKMVVKDNFIHADLHPGNLLVREECVKPWWWPGWLGPPHSQARLVLLDAGMVMELGQDQRDHILDFFKAIAQMDGNKVAEELLKFSNDGCPNPEEFESEMDAVFQKMRVIRDAGKTVTDGVAECLDTVRRHEVHVSAELLAVVTATVVLEGWSSVLDRDINILHLLKELLFKAEQMQDKMLEYLKVIT